MLTSFTISKLRLYSGNGKKCFIELNGMVPSSWTYCCSRWILSAFTANVLEVSDSAQCVISVFSYLLWEASFLK